MSDALLSVEVISKMESLSSGLKKGEKDITRFVTNSTTAIEGLEKVLNSLGVNTSTQGLQGLTAALTAQRLENERLRKSILQLQAGQAGSNTATQQAIAAINQQRLATEAMRTAAAGSRAQLEALRVTNTQNRTTLVALTGSYNEANNRLRELGRQIRSAQDGFRSTDPAIRANITEYRRLNQELQRFDTGMANNQRRVGAYRGALNGVGQQLSSVALSYISLYAVMAGAGSVLRTNAQLSDSLADVQRTAQITSDEAYGLAENLKKIDTRTTLKGLADLSVIGGQMGIAKDDLVGFSRAIDMLAVVLSGEIKGGAEEVATALGKINDVFKVQQREGTSVEESLNKTGSAILKLGQLGLATGEFLQDFSLRTAGIAQVMKLSVPTMLAYGSTLEEAGISAEVAGTAVVRLMSSLSSKRNEFFAIAKLGDSTLTLKKFTDTINNDTQKALSQFFAGLKAGNPTATEFSDRLDTINLKAGPSKNAIIALAENQAKLNLRIVEGTKAYDDGSLAAEQFAVKNDTLAASLAKLNNAISELTTNSAAATFFKTIIDNMTRGVEVLDEFSAKLQRFNDKDLIDRNANNKIPLSDPAEIKALAEARARRKAMGTAALMDDLKGKGNSDAQRIIANIKDEAGFTKVLANEKKRLADASDRLNYTLAYIKNPANVGAPLDAHIAKTNKLRAAYASQDERVKALTKSYNTLYGKPTVSGVKSSGINLPEPEDKKTGKAFDSVTTQLQAFQNRANIITKEGLAKDLQEWEDKYEKIKLVIAKLPTGDRKSEATTTLETNYKEGKSNILEANSREIMAVIKKRNDDIALLEMSGIAKEIQQITTGYEEQIRLAEGNAAGIAAIRKQQSAEITKVQEAQAAKDYNIIATQIADIAKEYREHQADMFNLAMTDGYTAVEVAENEKAKNELKQKYADRLIDFAAYQEQMAALIAKGNALDVKPPVFDIKHFSDTVTEAKATVNGLLENFVDSGIASALSDSFAGMGAAIMEGSNIFGAAAEGMQASFAQLLKALGEQFITMGVAKMAAGALLSPFGWKEIGQGAALVALGSGLAIGGGVAGSIGKGSGGSNSGGSSPKYGVPQFANGGIVSGPTLAMVGEYPGAKSDPEVISPLSKLKSMIGDRNTKQPTFIISNEISMGQLITAIRREENSR